MPSPLSSAYPSAPYQAPQPELTLRLTGGRPLTAVQVEKLFDAAQMQYGPERYSARVHQQDPYYFVLTLVPTPETSEEQERVAAEFQALLRHYDPDCRLSWSDAAAKLVEPLVEHEVARRAYELWEARGRPWGSPEQDWFRAEAEIRARPTHLTYLGAPLAAA